MKIGSEYEESTEKSTPGRVENGRKGRDVKRHGNQEKSEGNKPQKGGNGKRGTETKICSVENVRNAKKIANPTTKRAWNAKKRRKEGKKGSRERERVFSVLKK